MDKSFLGEYIHLEKLCNDIYGCNSGISKYLEDMEETSYTTKVRILNWDNTYKKLKELRWKRNQFVHEGNINFDEDDTEWLSTFYQQIIIGEDPLSLKRVVEIERARKSNLYRENTVEVKHARDNILDREKHIHSISPRLSQTQKRSSGGLRLFVLIAALIVAGAIAATVFLINRLL